MLDEGRKENQIAGYSIKDSDGGTITIVILPIKETEDNIDTTTT